ncbi:MAG: FAD-dependent oxidoreductase [Chitinophagaceae bacterium]|nr:FAD-dependent oxidoreductase [Chitinophagaceae bacterium]
MLLPWVKGIVIRIEQENSSTRRFWIQVPEMETFNFKPGQFVTLDLPIHEKPNKRWRSYSIASWPDGSNVFELVIVFLDSGLGTTYLFNEVLPGVTIMLRGPAGVFVLPEKLEKDLFLICTGTGVAPFRSMVHHIKNHGIVYQSIYLIFGCRKCSDLLYGSELKNLENEIPRFHYLPTFSQETEDSLEVRKGYVHAVYEEIIAGKMQFPQQQVPAHFYLCGWKKMIEEARLRIMAMGYNKKDIHFELYG